MELTPFEQALVAAAVAGEQLDAVPGEEIDVAEGADWGPERSVRAEVVEALVAGAHGPVHHRGVRLRGARVRGALDLSWAQPSRPLCLVQCHFDDPITAEGAELAQLKLSGSWVPALAVDEIKVKGDVVLDEGFSATGEVRLIGADIGGQLSCRGATLANAGGVALHADGATVKGDVVLDEGFSATGEVRLIGADIGGQLSCRGATLANAGGVALHADGATVKGGVFLVEGFSATGTVRLLGADIGGQLTCRGATLANAGGVALHADGATVKGGVLFDKGFSAAGEVRLLGADIGGQLTCRGATLANAGGDALHADGATVKGGVFLDEGFSATGTVRLLGADIGGQLSCRGATLANPGGYALAADEATVKGVAFLDEGFSAAGAIRLPGADINMLRWDDERVAGVLNLEGATVQRLADRWVHPAKPGGGARLNGFRWESFQEGTDDSLRCRLAWLRSCSDYAPQPYTQLAAVYRRSGHDDRARTVLIAREEDRRKRVRTSRRVRARSVFLGATIAHGYKPARALLAVMVLVVTGFGLLSSDPGRRAMVAAKAPTTQSAPRPRATSCPPDYPCFSPLVYAAETVIPLIELGQADNWQPAGGLTRYQLWVWGGDRTRMALHHPGCRRVDRRHPQGMSPETTNSRARCPG